MRPSAFARFLSYVYNLTNPKLGAATSLMTFLRALLAIGLCASCQGAWADQPHALNPFESISTIWVDVFVGESIGSVSREYIFVDQASRREAFQVALTQSLQSRLTERGFAVSPKETKDGLLSLGIWGHRVTPCGDPVPMCVYFIELSVVDLDWRPESACEDQRELDLSRRAIGVTVDAELERALTAEALLLLDVELPTP